MEKSYLMNLHEKFTDSSNTTIKLDELLEYLKTLSLKEQNEHLLELLYISNSNDKITLEKIKEYCDFLNQRNSSNGKKRKVESVRKINSNYKKFINDEIINYANEIKLIISMNYDEFVLYIKENDIDYNFIMLGLIREINYYKALADEAYLNKEMDVLLEAKELYLDLQTKLNFLRNVPKKSVVVEKEKFNIIFLETSSMRSYFLEDIKGLDEYYDSFKKLFLSLQEGNPYDIKYFASIDKNLDGLLETRDISGKTRIFFKQLNENTYIIIGAIVKKVDKSMAYKNQLENRYKNYLQQETLILSNLDNQEFIERQDEYMETVIEKFEIDSKSLLKGGK